MIYWQYQVEKHCSVDEFVSLARKTYSYDVPTFREAFRSLIRSLFRTRIINKQIPDLDAAIAYMENQGLLSVERVNYPSEWEWNRLKEGKSF